MPRKVDPITFKRRQEPVAIEAAEFQKIGPGVSPQPSTMGAEAAADYHRNLEQFTGGAYPSRRRSEANDLKKK